MARGLRGGLAALERSERSGFACSSGGRSAVAQRAASGFCEIAEVDHKLPLFKLWREHRDMPWPRLLGFWGLPNLQVINRDAHAQKCAEEARSRREPVRAPPPLRPTVRELLAALEPVAAA